MMNFRAYCIYAAGFFCCLLISGCVSLISGDLKNVPHARYQPCERNVAAYRIDFDTDAEDAYATGGLAPMLTGFSLGLIPSLRTRSAYSRARLYQHDTLIKSYRFDSRITIYYGFLWLLFLDTNSVNALEVDEGAGVRARSGIRDRTIAKVLSQNNLGIESSLACYSDDLQKP